MRNFSTNILILKIKGWNHYKKKIKDSETWCAWLLTPLEKMCDILIMLILVDNQPDQENVDFSFKIRKSTR